MSSLDGHLRITTATVQRLRRDCARHPLAVGLSGANLPYNVVLRDMSDVLNTGHWQNFGQRHHFMRRFGSAQTEWEAYQENISWIYTNARRASIQLMRYIGRYLSRPRSSGGAREQYCELPPARSAGHRASQLYSGSAQQNGWRHFGWALHALQDSFSEGHVRRVHFRSAQQPGRIDRILRYEGAEADGHAGLDEAWHRSGSNLFSARGEAAIAASRALIVLVLSQALNNYRDIQLARSPFAAFSRRWIQPTSELARR